MEKQDIHIGSMIKDKMKEMHISPTEFAKRLGYSLPGATNILTRKMMQTDVLLKVCKVLGYDFFKHYTDCPPIAIGGITYDALEKELTERQKEIGDLKKELEYLKKIVELYAEKK